MGCDDDRGDTVSGRTGIAARLGPLDVHSRRPEPRHVRVKPIRRDCQRKKPSVMFCLAADPEQLMYRSVSLPRESSGDFTIVTTFALLGLALSLLAIGHGVFISPEYMMNLLLLF